MTNEAMKAAIELEIASCLGTATTQVIGDIVQCAIAEAIAAERERVLPLARKAFDAGIDAGAEATARHYHGQKRLGQDDLDKQFEHIAKAIRDGAGS